MFSNCAFELIPFVFASWSLSLHTAFAYQVSDSFHSFLNFDDVLHHWVWLWLESISYLCLQGIYFMFVTQGYTQLMAMITWAWMIIASCSIEILRFLTISIVELKNTHFRRVLPVFWAFPVRGPITITSRACERSNDGPKDRKCPKNG